MLQLRCAWDSRFARAVERCVLLGTVPGGARATRTRAQARRASTWRNVSRTELRLTVVAVIHNSRHQARACAGQCGVVLTGLARHHADVRVDLGEGVLHHARGEGVLRVSQASVRKTALRGRLVADERTRRCH